MKFSIITPCYNAEKYIAETVESVLTQSAILSGRAELEYIIRDGKSNDRTLEIIEETLKKRTDVSINVLSEKDSGMYHALSKGLTATSGDICAYINAGDYFNKHAFDVVLDVFEGHEISWLTGMTVICNEDSQIVNAVMPCGYRSRLIKAGQYGVKLPNIQQESTFWKRELNRRIDFQALSKFRHAGDYFLWYQFAQATSLVLVEAHLGTFRIHQGQISEDVAGYIQEMASFCDQTRIGDRILTNFDRVLWHMPRMIQKSLHWLPALRFDHASQKWSFES